jgi:hypothetical protein
VRKYKNLADTISKTNELIRKGFIREYFSKVLRDLGYRETEIFSDRISFISPNSLIYISFDIKEGSYYGDAHEWFFVDFIIAFPLKRFPVFSKEIREIFPLYFGRREFVRYGGRSTGKKAFDRVIEIEKDMEKFIREYLI